MRTDTATFRRNAFKTLRIQGLSSAKARKVSDILGRRLRFRAELPTGTEIRVSMDDADAQRISFVKDATVVFRLDYDDLEGLQPLVNTTPTARQLELQDAMSDLISTIYSAMDAGEAAFAAEHGDPHDERDYTARSAFVKGFGPYQAAHAAYEALKSESLAINPNVSASVVDPERASFWYEWHRDAYSFRPSGFRTLAAIEKEMETMPREIMDEAA